MDMCYDGALVMPSSFTMMDEEEMMYTEGGALPNWFVAGVIDTVITAIIGGSLSFASSYFRKQAAKYGAKAAGLVFSEQLRKKLIAKKIASNVAAGICKVARTGFIILTWATDPGGQLASYIDSRDGKPNNDWCWG